MPVDGSRPAYVLALFHAPDIDAYRRDYGRRVLNQLEAFGATLLVASEYPTVLEGDWQPTWTAVIRFPDRDTARRWYESEAYAPLKKLRVEALTTGGSVAIFDEYERRPAGP